MTKEPNNHSDPLQHSLSALKGRVSVSTIFLLYLHSGGDRFKVAAASNLSVEEVDALARSENWAAKLEDRRKMAGDGKKSTEDINREVARLKASAQAERLQQEIEQILCHLEKLPPEDKLKYLFETDRTGKTSPTAKFFLDLAKAVETCSQSLFRATGDQLAMRPDAVDSAEVGKQIGSGVAEGMAAMFAKNKQRQAVPIPIELK